MADKLKFDLVSPERAILCAEVDAVCVPGRAGDFEVLPAHSPLISTLRPGVLQVTDGTTQSTYFLPKGFADVTPQGLTVLAETAIPIDELSGARLRTLREQAQNALSTAGDDVAEKAAAEELIAALAAY